MTAARRMVTLGLACAGASLLAPPGAWAQGPRVAERTWIAEPVQLTLDVQRAGALDGTALLLPAAAVVQGRSRAAGTTFMIVGGAMFVGGLLIGNDGGTIIALAGVGIGAYGLYLYLR